MTSLKGATVLTHSTKNRKHTAERMDGCAGNYTHVPSTLVCLLYISPLCSSVYLCKVVAPSPRQRQVLGLQQDWLGLSQRDGHPRNVIVYLSCCSAPRQGSIRTIRNTTTSRPQTSFYISHIYPFTIVQADFVLLISLVIEETLITLVHHWAPELVSDRQGPRLGPELPVLSRQDLDDPVSPCCIQHCEWQSTDTALKDRGRLKEDHLSVCNLLSVWHVEVWRQLTFLPVLVPQDSTPILF